jgi:hypothetical protein
MSRIPLIYHTNIKFYTQYTHPMLICRGADAHTHGRTENIYSIFRDKLLLLGEHVYHYMFYQERTDNRVSMIHLNPVTTGKHCVERGLFSTDNDLFKELTHRNFKTVLLTNATTNEGEDDVAKYFKVQKQWNELLFQWKEEGKVVIGFEWYKLLFLVKSTSQVDHIWFSFFEGMHHHAAIVAGLVCSKFNHSTSGLEPGSLTVEDFRNGNI